MKYLIIVPAALAGICAASCSKSKKAAPAPIDSSGIYLDYMAMRPGNYWIYQDYKIDTGAAGVQALGTFDSCYIEKDTMIGTNTYHKYCEVSYGSTSAYDIFLLRDSLSYVVDPDGVIHFSSTNFTDTFRSYEYYNPVVAPDTFHITEQMGFKDVSIAVDAGTFVTSTLRRIIHYPPSYPFGPTREYDRSYSVGVGMIRQTTAIYNSVPYYFERRLVRYHVQ